MDPHRREYPCQRCCYSLVKWKVGSADPTCVESENGSTKCERCRASGGNCVRLGSKLQDVGRRTQNLHLRQPRRHGNTLKRQQLLLRKALQQFKMENQENESEVRAVRRRAAALAEHREAKQDALEGIYDALHGSSEQLRLLRQVAERLLPGGPRPPPPPPGPDDNNDGDGDGGDDDDDARQMKMRRVGYTLH